MTREDFEHYIAMENGLLETIKNANVRKEKIKKSSLSREDKAKMFTFLSEGIRNIVIDTHLYIHNNYFDDFEQGLTNTIDPYDDRIKLELTDTDDVKAYKEVRCNFWGPCDDFLYFMSPIRIVVVHEEAYVLEGEYKDLCENKRHHLGGNKQNEHFRDYESLEASTPKNSVSFCTRLLREIQRSDDKDCIMKNNLCFLENNFFPALALAGNVSSDRTYTKKWAELFSEILRELLKFYEPDIVLGQRDNLGYLSLKDPGIFNQALGGIEILRQMGQSLLGRDIEIADRIKTGKNKCGAIVDKMGTIWIGYTYFSRSFWSGYKGENIINWIKNHIRLRRE